MPHKALDQAHPQILQLNATPDANAGLASNKVVLFGSIGKKYSQPYSMLASKASMGQSSKAIQSTSFADVFPPTYEGPVQPISKLKQPLFDAAKHYYPLSEHKYHHQGNLPHLPSTSSSACPTTRLSYQVEASSSSFYQEPLQTASFLSNNYFQFQQQHQRKPCSQGVHINTTNSQSLVTLHSPQPSPSLHQKQQHLVPTKASFIQDFATAGMIACVSRTTFAPILRVQTLLQTQKTNTQLNTQSAPYRGIADCFVRVYREQGLLSFWRGNFAAVLRVFPTMAFNFAFNDAIKNGQTNSGQQSWLVYAGQRMLTGGASGLLTCTIVHPLELIQTKMTADIGSGHTRNFRSLTHCAQYLVYQRGISSLYTAIIPSAIGSGLYRSLYFGLFDTVKTAAFQRLDFGNRYLESVGKLFIAIPICLGAGLMCYPLHTVTRRLMLQAGESKWYYAGFWDCVRKMAVEEGWKGFYAGASAATFQMMGGAIILWAYDELKTVSNT